MRFSKRFFHRLSNKFALLGTGSVLAFASLVAVGTYAVLDTNAHSGGITGVTQKSNNNGCYCHCASSNSNTTVTLASTSGTSPLTTAPNMTYNFTIEVASTNSSENDGGCDVASYAGNTLTAGTGLYNSGGELTHSSPLSFNGNGHCTWSFTYTTGSTAGWDTLYATGNAVTGGGGYSCSDNWNFAPKFIIHNVVPTVRMALSKSTISFGQLRVGHRVADSLKVTSNGQAAITISSSGMKSGAEFSSYPTTTNRTINAGSSEIDSAIFTPTARGTFNDSLIFNTNSDTLPEQEMGLYVSGQGIQAIFNSTNGTSLAFGNLRVGRTAQQTFSFSNTGDDTLFLQTPSISGTGFTIATGPSTLTYPPNGSGSVVVQFAPTAKQSYSGSLTFTASNGVSAPTVSLSGAGILPQIQFSNSDNLGSIRVGQTLQGTAIIKNIGNDTLHVTNAMLTQTASLFTLGSYGQAVIPNANDTLHLSYTPAAEETDNATLTFTTDDPSNTSVSIALTGSGVLPHMAVAEKNDTVSLGQVKVNSFATTSISVNNTGGADLTLSSVTAGPAPFSLVSSPNVVSAGTSGNISVGFSPTDTGVFTGKLVIQGNDAANPSDTVYLKGTGVNSALSINPGSINFGSVPILETVLDTITLSDSGKANVNIQSVQLQPSNGAFSIVGSTPTVVVAGGSALIVVSFKPDTAGNYSGSVTLTTDDASAPMRTINLSGLGIKDPFSVTPSQIDFGQVPIVTTVMDTITMHNTGTASVTISSYQLSAPSGGFAVADSSKHVIIAGGAAIVVVSFDPAAATSYSGSLTLHTNDVSSPVRTISLAGIGIKGSLAINPPTLNFGNDLVLHDSSMHAELRNAGLASVTVNAISISGQNNTVFSYGTFATPATITAGDSTSIDMSFTPANAESYQDTLHLVLGDGTAIDVLLVGAGVNSGVSQIDVGTSQFSLSLSPNPAENSVNVHTTISQSAEMSLDVFDDLGHAMIHTPLGMLTEGEHDITLPTESLASGSYFVRIGNSEGSAVEARLVIEKK